MWCRSIADMLQFRFFRFLGLNEKKIFDFGKRKIKIWGRYENVNSIFTYNFCKHS